MPEPRRSNRTFEVLARAALSLTLLVAASSTSGVAQTISGTLLDAESDRPIPLGLVMMFTTEGDSITATVSDPRGRFQVSSPEPGSFVLIASAFGYDETSAGVFDLGEGGEMQVEYRLPSRPLPIDEVLVSIDRPTVQHHLVRNGFVRRFQRGLGHFVTPYDIESSPARSTEALMQRIPGVEVGTVRGGSGLPMPHLGEVVRVVGPMGPCTPQIYVDGLPMAYSPSDGFTLSQFAPLHDVEAIEVYRRIAEFPVEFSARRLSRNSETESGCGIIVVWTKQGLARGQPPESYRADRIPEGAEGLPDVTAEGPPPVKGESIRLELDEDEAREAGLESPWQGTFEDVDDDVMVVVEEDTGRPVALPLDAVSEIQVSRRKGGLDAWRRGFIGGAVAGLGTWGFLEILCAHTCGPTGRAGQETVVPGVLAGLAAGALVVAQGPGRHWVRTSVSGSEDRSGSGDAGGAAIAPVGGAVIGPGPLPGTLRLGWRFSLR